MRKTKKGILALAFGLLLTNLPLNVSAETTTGSEASPSGQVGKVKDVYIDNTIDESRSYVTGVVHLLGDVGTAEGYNPGKEVYSNSAAVTYSNPKTATVQEMIDAAYDKAKAIAEEVKAKGLKGEFHISTSESVGQVWDHRTYQTIEDSDAVLLDGGVKLESSSGYTRTHIASGNYGKNTYYRVEVNGWVSSEADITYEFTDDTANQIYTIGVDGEATFKVDADYALFENGGAVYIDDELVDESNYTSKSGSTIITFSKAYMNTLSAGKHTLAVTFSDGGVATTNFVVMSGSATTASTTSSTSSTTSNPKTGDNLTSYITVLALSTFGLLLAGIYVIRNSKKTA